MSSFVIHSGPQAGVAINRVFSTIFSIGVGDDAGASGGERL